jgi:hypothetical protein
VSGGIRVTEGMVRVITGDALNVDLRTDIKSVATGMEMMLVASDWRTATTQDNI